MSSTNDLKPDSQPGLATGFHYGRPFSARRRPGDLLGWLILILVLGFVGFGLSRYWLRPLLTQRLPEHQARSVDAPPLELTSFAIRLDGADQTPVGLAASGDSIFVSLHNSNAIQVYSGNLDLLKTIRLTTPSVMFPDQIALADSLLVITIADDGGMIMLDREGDYLRSASWYPDRRLRLNPVGLWANGESAVVSDTVNKAIAVISLVRREPFADIFELLDLVSFADLEVASVGMAVLDRSGRLWVGDPGHRQIRIFDLQAKSAIPAEMPTKSRIVNPVAAAFNPDGTRLHILDKGSGKVLVYDLDGRLRLVYPQDRALAAPTAIAFNAVSRTILITESQPAVVSVFGY